jgi:hypothetical protein
MLRHVAKAALLISMASMLVLPAAGCGSKKSKGGGVKGAAAKDAGQKTGGTATGDKAKAKEQMGDTYEGVKCDSTTEGLGWCDSETEIAFCSGGGWYLLDCTGVGGDFCGDDGATVDCYVPADF